MTIKVGDVAPEFSLPNHLGQKITLRHYRGKQNVVLAFFPLAWTPV